MITDSDFADLKHALIRHEKATQESVRKRRSLGSYNTDAPDILLALDGNLTAFDTCLALLEHVRHLTPVGKTDIAPPKKKK